MDYFFNHN